MDYLNLNQDERIKLESLLQISNIKIYDYSKEKDRIILERVCDEDYQKLDKFLKVITLRFGIYDGVFHTLKYIAHELSVSIETTRKIQEKALSKLSNYSVTRMLGIAYLDDNESVNKKI